MPDGRVTDGLLRPQLDWLLAPVDSAIFFAEFFERRVLRVERQDPGYHAHLLSLDQMDYLIGSAGLFHPEISMVSAEKPLKVEEYCYPNDRADATRIFQLFADGATVIMPQLHERLPALLALCRGLERQFSARFQTNIYMTPAHAKGFPVHYDTHDVFVLQVAGSKLWRIYDVPVELPLPGQGFQRGVHKAGALAEEFVLKPGDMLYIPRGVMHEAISCGDTSLHITAGLLQKTWADLMVEAMQRLTERDARFRRALPPGFAQPDFDPSAARETFAALLETMRAEMDFDDALAFFVDDLVRTRLPVLDGQIHELARLKTLAPGSRCGCRPNLIYSVRRLGETVEIACQGQTITMPAHASEAALFALETRDFAVSDLPGPLDGEGKLVLIRRLVREGLVRIHPAVI